MLTASRQYSFRVGGCFIAIAAAVDNLGVVLESTLLAERELARDAPGKRGCSVTGNAVGLFR